MNKNIVNFQEMFPLLEDNVLRPACPFCLGTKCSWLYMCVHWYAHRTFFEFFVKYSNQENLNIIRYFKRHFSHELEAEIITATVDDVLEGNFPWKWAISRFEDDDMSHRQDVRAIWTNQLEDIEGWIGLFCFHSDIFLGDDGLHQIFEYLDIVQCQIDWPTKLIQQWGGYPKSCVNIQWMISTNHPS